MQGRAGRRRRPRADAEALAVVPLETGTHGSTPEDHPASNDVIDEVVAEIFALGRNAQLGLVLAIGEVILRRFYHGDVATWRRRAAKDVSLRKLAEKLDNSGLVGFSPIYLSRAVALHELSLRLPVLEWHNLTASHLRAVLALPEGRQQALLARADEQRWSVRALEEEVKRGRETTEGRGRPRLPAFVKTIHLLGRLVENELAFGDLDKVAELEDAEAADLLKKLSGMKARCDALQAALERRGI